MSENGTQLMVLPDPAIVKAQAEMQLASTLDAQDVRDPHVNPLLMTQLYRSAKAFAASKVVPDHFRGDPDSCFVVLAMARRHGEDPLALLQNMYLVHGRPGFFTEYLIARARQQGLDLRWRVVQGQAPVKDLQNVEVTCYVHGDTDPDRATKLSTADAVRAGWTKSDQYKHNMERMLRWRTASWWISLYAPHIKHGLPTVEDMEAEAPERIRIDPDAKPPRAQGAEALKAALSVTQVPSEPPPPDAPASAHPHVDTKPEPEGLREGAASPTLTDEQREYKVLRTKLHEVEGLVDPKVKYERREAVGIERITTKTPNATLAKLLALYSPQQEVKPPPPQEDEPLPPEPTVSQGKGRTSFIADIAAMRTKLGEEVYLAVRNEVYQKANVDEGAGFGALSDERIVELWTELDKEMQTAGETL